MSEIVCTTELYLMMIKPGTTPAVVFLAWPSSPFLIVAALPGRHEDMQSVKLEGFCYSPKSDH